MSNLEYIFNTQIKGQHISCFENFANTLLTPVFYFCNGKKVDFIREGNQNVCHYKPVFGLRKEGAHTDFYGMYPTGFSEPVSNSKHLFYMVVLLPGLVIGGILKSIAVIFHSTEGRTLVERCIDGAENQFVADDNSAELLNKVKNLASDLFECYNRHLDDSVRHSRRMAKELPFLAECENVNLPGVNVSFCEDNHVDYTATINQNKRILRQIHLLWNLHFIEVNNHYDLHREGFIEEKEALMKINPTLVYRSKENNYQTSISTTAIDFFGQLPTAAGIN